MKKIKDTSAKIKVIFTKVITLIWVIAIATGGLYTLDLIALPSVLVKAFGIGLLTTAVVTLYKSIK